MSKYYDELEKVGRIVSRKSNSVPLPVGYKSNLPDHDPVNVETYCDFHNQVGQVIQDGELESIEKIVMIAYLLRGEDTSDSIIQTDCGISFEQLSRAQIHLMNTRWLKSK